MKEPDMKKMDKMQFDDLISCADDVFQNQFEGSSFPNANPSQLLILKEDAQRTLATHREGKTP
jgi:hypothetical protein